MRGLKKLVLQERKDRQPRRNERPLGTIENKLERSERQFGIALKRIAVNRSVTQFLAFP